MIRLIIFLSICKLISGFCFYFQKVLDDEEKERTIFIVISKAIIGLFFALVLWLIRKTSRLNLKVKYIGINICLLCFLWSLLWIEYRYEISELITNEDDSNDKFEEYESIILSWHVINEVIVSIAIYMVI